MRNKVIDRATELIKGNKINFDAFLKQVTFDKQKVCGGMLAFERLDPLDGEDIYDQLDYEHEAIVVDNTEQATVPLCAICKNAFPAVILLPCRHQCVCIDCYRKWNQVDTEMFDALPFADYNDVEIFNRPNDEDRPNKDTVCPVCKKPVENFIESILS